MATEAGPEGGIVLLHLSKSYGTVHAVRSLDLAIAPGQAVELAKSGPMFDVMTALPSYWLVQAGKSVAVDGGGWPGQAWLVIAAWTVVLVPIAGLAYRRTAAGT